MLHVRTTATATTTGAISVVAATATKGVAATATATATTSGAVARCSTVREATVTARFAGYPVTATDSAGHTIAALGAGAGRATNIGSGGVGQSLTRRAASRPGKGATLSGVCSYCAFSSASTATCGARNAAASGGEVGLRVSSSGISATATATDVVVCCVRAVTAGVYGEAATHPSRSTATARIGTEGVGGSFLTDCDAIPFGRVKRN